MKNIQIPQNVGFVLKYLGGAAENINLGFFSFSSAHSVVEIAMNNMIHRWQEVENKEAKIMNEVIHTLSK